MNETMTTTDNAVSKINKYHDEMKTAMLENLAKLNEATEGTKELMDEYLIIDPIINRFDVLPLRLIQNRIDVYRMLQETLNQEREWLEKSAFIVSEERKNHEWTIKNGLA